MAKSDAAYRQADVTKRRKHSGLITKKFHCSKDSIEKLKSIGQDMEFTSSELSNNENLSSIIEVCIDSFLSRSLKGKPLNKNALYLNKLCNIIKFREQKGYHDGAIVGFLLDWSYKTPVLFDPETKKTITYDTWNTWLVEKLKNEEFVQTQIQQLNNLHKRKKVIVTRKIKPSDSPSERNSD